jgi:hypothetical protein
MANWKRYRFKTRAVEDYRPLEFNPCYPWWCTGSGDDFVTIVAYLPEGEDLYKYWDDADDVDVEDREEISFTDRFPKPSYFKELEEEKSIPINIWDDFWEDGYVPDGEIQETYAYVEDSEIPQEDRKVYLDFLMNHLKTKEFLSNVDMQLTFYRSREEYPSLVGTEYESMLFERWEIRFKHLTHKDIHKILEELESQELVLNNHPIRVYSES